MYYMYVYLLSINVCPTAIGIEKSNPYVTTDG